MALADSYDAFLCDLDGVIWLGHDFLPGAVERQAIHAGRMVLAMGGHRVAGVAHLAHPRGIVLGLASDQKKGRLGAMGGENVEDLVGVFRQRSVIESQHHLVVFERQRLVILHGADDGVRARIDHDGARCADSVRMAGAIGRRRSLRGYRTE